MKKKKLCKKKNKKKTWKKNPLKTGKKYQKVRKICLEKNKKIILISIAKIVFVSYFSALASINSIIIIFFSIFKGRGKSINSSLKLRKNAYLKKKNDIYLKSYNYISCFNTAVCIIDGALHHGWDRFWDHRQPTLFAAQINRF